MDMLDPVQLRKLVGAAVQDRDLVATILPGSALNALTVSADGSAMNSTWLPSGSSQMNILTGP